MMQRDLALHCALGALVILASLTACATPSRADWIQYAILNVHPNTVYVGVETLFTYELCNGMMSSMEVMNVSIHFDWQPTGGHYFLTSGAVPLSAESSRGFTLLITIPQVATGEHLQTIQIEGRADGDSQSSTMTQSNTFNVNTPTVTASADKTSGLGKVTVQFSASASGGTAPYSYYWTFGDGSSSSKADPLHTYSTAGTYTARLVVTDSQSSTVTYEVGITVVPSKNDSLPIYVGIIGAIGLVTELSAFFLLWRRGKSGQQGPNGGDKRV